MPSRLGKHPQVSLSMIPPCSSATAHDAHDHNRNLLHHHNHSEQRYPIPTPGPSHVDNGTANSSTSVTGDVEGKTDGGGCEAESDNKEADDEHEDDVAPSDSAIVLGDGQAGHTRADRTGSLTMAGQKRKRSVSLEGENLATAGPKDPKPDEKPGEAEEISDADDYAGVDLISDSEEVECNIEKLEENDIIASEEGRWNRFTPTLDLSSENWYHDSLGYDDTPYFDEEFRRTDSITLSNNSELDNPTVIIRDQSTPPCADHGRRRVHFADPQSLPLILSVDDGLESPQYEQSTSFYREEGQMSNPRRLKVSQDDGNKCAFLLKTRRNSQVGPKKRQDGRVGISPLDQSFEGSCGSSSGYDSDLGETTEEEEIMSHRTQALLRRASQSKLRRKRPRAPKTLHKPSQRGHRPGPLLGTWIPASTKPIALMNKTCTSLIVYRIPKKPQTKQTTFHRVGTDISPVDAGFSMSWPSFSSDPGFSMSYTELGCSDKSSLQYAARFARPTGPVFIPPQLLHRNPGMSTHKYRLIDDDLPSPATYFSQSEWSHEETFSPNEDSEEKQDETVDLDSFLDFSNDAEEDWDNQEHLAATTRDSSPPTMMNPQIMPTEAQSPPNSFSHSPQGLATALHNDEHYPVAQTPAHQHGNALDPLDFTVDYGLFITNSASLSPDVRPSKKRRMSDIPNRSESINQAKAALAAMSECM